VCYGWYITLQIGRTARLVNRIFVISLQMNAVLLSAFVSACCLLLAILLLKIILFANPVLPFICSYYITLQLKFAIASLTTDKVQCCVA